MGANPGQTAPKLPPEVYGAFSGAIDQASVQRVIFNFTGAMGSGVTRVHLFFHSSGGSVGDGIALFNFFRALPIDLIVYNPGIVASIATIAYLGAKKRKTSAHAIFGIHRSRFQPPQPASALALENLADTARMDDRRTETILRANTRIPDDVWARVDQGDVFFTADQAVEYGIADEVADFSPPAGSQIFTV